MCILTGNDTDQFCYYRSSKMSRILSFWLDLKHRFMSLAAVCEKKPSLMLEQSKCFCTRYFYSLSFQCPADQIHEVKHNINHCAEAFLSVSDEPLPMFFPTFLT